MLSLEKEIDKESKLKVEFTKLRYEYFLCPVASGGLRIEP
jgi:hypothetical protein